MSQKALVPHRDTGKPGPAMSQLRARQQAFVMAVLETGGQAKQANLAKMAGYTGNDVTLQTTGFRLMHDAKVIAAIKEEADRRLQSGSLLATSVLVEIAQNPMHKDRFKAAVAILERTGFVAKTEHTVNVHDDRRSNKELLAEVLAVAAQLGVDPQKLLGRPMTVEAEFTEVKADEPFDAAEGLEDLI